MATTRKATNPVPLDPEAPIVIEFEGETYTWTRDDMDDLDLLQLFAAGQIFDAMHWLLGDEDWQRLRASIATDKGRVPMTKMKAFVELASEPLGNFAASLRS